MNNITITPIKNLPEFSPKHDLADELIKGFENNNIALEDNDVIVVTQKIVSKAENRLIENNFENIEELIKKESLEILRKRGDTIIARTKLLLRKHLSISSANSCLGSNSGRFFIGMIVILFMINNVSS